MAGDPLDWLDDELERLQQATLLRRPTIRGGAQQARVIVDGQELLNFGSNDYLGLASDPRLGQAVSEALRRNGWGAGASPLITGRSALHAELERHVAAFEGAEAALVFSTGFAANMGIIPALVGRGDLILSDAKNHASIIDGCRLSGAELRVYPHGEVEAVDRWLQESAGQVRRCLIVTDALFSMDGDLAPLGELAHLARQHRAMLMVDEAHATGVLGPGGRGVSALYGVEEHVPIRVGTFSKALGSVGGFVVGSRRLIDWLYNRTRSYVFSTAQPAAVAAACLAALKIVRDEPQRRETLVRRAAELREQLRHEGWNVGTSQSQIIPLIIGSAERTMQLSDRLRQRGFLVPGIRPPSVPAGESLLRISLTWSHGPEEIKRLLDALRSLVREHP